MRKYHHIFIPTMALITMIVLFFLYMNYNTFWPIRLMYLFCFVLVIYQLNYLIHIYRNPILDKSGNRFIWMYAILFFFPIAFPIYYFYYRRD
jgi:hypothetical protein